MHDAIFDPITNSEDEMLLRAKIHKSYAPTYLRAYIMASLCIEPQFVLSDSAANLNRAFRTLVDVREAKGYNLNYLPKADFNWLISEGHIRFAARDKYRGCFSDGLRKAQKDMKTVDQPSEQYTKHLDEICSDSQVYWFNLENVSRMFTNNFREGIEAELGSPDLPPRREWAIRQLMDQLADRETYKYGDIKPLLLKYLNKGEEDYRAIRKIMRQAYEYNVPNELGLDYNMYMPSRNSETLLRRGGRLELVQELSWEESIRVDFACSVHGFAALRAKSLKYIWASSEYEAFQRQLRAFRNGTVNLNEYLQTLSRYLQVINECVADDFTQKYYDYKNDLYEKRKPSNLWIKVRQYNKGDEPLAVVVKAMEDAWNMGSIVKDILMGSPVSPIVGLIFKLLSTYARKKSTFPELPKEVNEAIILQHPEPSQTAVATTPGQEG